MKNIFEKYRHHYGQEEFLISALTGIALLVVSLLVNYAAGIYATLRESNAVTDLLLSNIPVFDVDGIFIYGTIVFGAFVALLVLANPEVMPFTLKSLSLFILIRSFFISLTHIGPFPTHVPFAQSFIVNKLFFDGDLFFSGHTGMPFLMALLFWPNKKLRYLFLATSATFAISALMGHFHYSIDVFAAYFITYTIFEIAQKLFPSDFRIFRQSPAVSVAA